MVQILQPLEIRDGHTASVQVHVLQEETQQTQTPVCSYFTCLCVWTVCLLVLQEWVYSKTVSFNFLYKIKTQKKTSNVK